MRKAGLGEEGAGLQDGCHLVLTHPTGCPRAEIALQSCLRLRQGARSLYPSISQSPSVGHPWKEMGPGVKQLPADQAGHSEGCSCQSAAAKSPSRCTLEKKLVPTVLSALKEKSEELECVH